ncbi:response regulator [Pseudorhodoferax sp. Leaf265]|uniref:response regulator n=1 Tax=Pseudorhodoferax sp. Leaf265 TaxID=1736315 RepID=UPI00350F2992
MTELPMPLAVYLVEDVEIIRDSLIEALEDLAGARIVATAQDEAGALAWLRRHPSAWKLAVIDLFLTQGSGIGVLKAIANRGADQHAVVLTNYATADIRQRCMNAGANRVFDKSTQLEEFLDYCRGLA